MAKRGRPTKAADAQAVQSRLRSAMTAEELERVRCDQQLLHGYLWHRVPVSTVRIEVLDQAGVYVVACVPSMRQLVRYEFKANAEYVQRELDLLTKSRRHDLTRPDGTCPKCSSALMRPSRFELRHRKDGMGWCPKCMQYVIPAGARAS